MLLFHKNSGRGMPPDPRHDLSCATRRGRPTWPGPGSPRPDFVSRAIGVLAGPDRRTGLPGPLQPCARRSSPSPGRAEPVPPTGTFGRDSFRPGWEGTRPRLKERTESVPEAGGTGAEAVATPPTPPRRSLRGLSREADGGTSGDGPPGGTFGRPNRERCRSGGLSWGSKGAEHPLASPRLYRGYAAHDH